MTQNNNSNPNYTICVFCGSNPGNRTHYRSLAERFGQAIAREGWGLIYGAGKSGLMGTLARSVLNSSGHAMGVIPSKFPDEVQPGLTYTIKTTNIQERKSVMFNCSDAVVVLPGGIGTLEEFFEVLTWKQLGWHSKPMIVLNAHNYWDSMNQLVETVTRNEFAGAVLGELYHSESSVEGVMERLRADFSRRNCSTE